MKQITLPNTDLSVSSLAYGTASFDGSFPSSDGLKLVEKFLAAGGNFIDTAHCYCFWVKGGDGASERFVGECVRKFGRDRLVVATKGGHIGMNGYPRPDAFLDPSLVRKDVDESLDRLGIETIDLYYLHRDDPRVPASEIIEQLNEHVASGRVRYLGASNWSVERTLAANAYAAAKGLQPFVMLQNQWSLANPNWTDLDSPGAMRTILESEFASLEASQLAVSAYGSTANGYFATAGERGQGFESPKTRRQLAAVQAIAKAHSATPNQIALAYLLNQPFPVVALLGTRDHDHLDDALGSSEIELSAEELQALAS